MERFFWIGGFSALTFGLAAAFGRMLLKRKKWLDLAYHNALHAESIGQYAVAIDLYQSILDRSRRNPLVDEETRVQIRQRINTLRYQQDYLKQFAEDKQFVEDKKLPAGEDISGALPLL
jgi:hypothetical protein